MYSLQKGDFILVKTDHFVSKLIRFGQRSYGKGYAEWNHAALVVYGDGDGPRIVEALTTGVVYSPLAKYKLSQIMPVKTFSSTGDIETAMRRNAANFAESCVGQKYGFITITAIAIKTLFKGTRFDFAIQDTSICSGLVARSLERMGYDWNPYEPSELTPAYLAKEFS